MTDALAKFPQHDKNFEIVEPVARQCCLRATAVAASLDVSRRR